MSIKRLYKKTVPAGVRNFIAGHPWVEHLRNRQLVRDGQRLAAAAQATRKPDSKIRVTFIVQRPALWSNQKSVYEAMIADPAFEVSVIAIPKRPPAATEVDLTEYARLKIFLKEKGIPFSEGYDESARTWINPLTFGLPDVVFLPQPYAHTQSYLYHSAYLKSFCQLAYYEYGLQVADMEFMFYLPIYNDCRYIFLESEFHRKMYMERVPHLENKLFVTGHPKLDLYNEPLALGMNLWKCPNAKYHIIWAPHFTVADNTTPHHFSTFFKYYDHFIEFAKAHPEVEIVLRPHPELFAHMIWSGMRTRAESDAYREHFNALPNGQVYEGADIYTLFRQSDALILDCQSFLAEYLPTGKPICFLESLRRERLNEMGEKLLHSYYAAWDQAELFDFLQNVVLGQNDYRKEERMRMARQYFALPPGGSGNAIKNVIKADSVYRQ